MNDCMLSLDKKLELWEASLPQDKLILLAYAAKKDVDEAVNAQNRLYNETVDTSYMAAFSDKFEDLTIEELRGIIRQAYYYINDYKNYIESEGENYMKKVEKVEKELKAFLEKEMEAGTLKSETIIKAKKKFGIPAKDISNEWLVIKEENSKERTMPKETKKKLSESHKKKENKEESENKANTEEEKQGNVITPKTENEAVEEATGVQKEEIKSTLVEITEVRKFKGQFGEYEKSKDGVKIEELLVSSKEDAEKLGNELADKFSKELEEFVKKQQEQKKVAFGRLEEIKELLNM